MMSVTREVGTLTSIGPKRHAHRACHKRQVTQASYNKQGEDSLRVDGKVTRLWKVFFKPGSGYTDRLGVAIPMGDALDEVGSTATAIYIQHSRGDKACLHSRTLH